jgi:hypothetical protein
MYAIVLAMLMVIELVGFIMAFTYKAQLEQVYKTALFDVLKNGLLSNNTKILEPFRDLEKNMQCCGVHGFSDYIEFNNSTQVSDGCKQHPTVGCAQAIIDFLNANLPKISITLGCVLAIELFGLIAAIILAVALKDATKASKSENFELNIKLICSSTSKN